MNKLFFLLLIVCTACQPRTQVAAPEGIEGPAVSREKLVRVHVIDHNNLSETITNAEKLKDFEKKDFFGSQPYEKVVRVFEKGKDGSNKSLITSYYENGLIRQYLECLNGRACGVYREWYSSGKKKASSHVIAGQADVGDKAPITWSFDGVSEAWDEEGTLLARICYQKGKLQGLSETFYPSGNKKRVSVFEKGELEGKNTLFNEEGTAIEEISYVQGKREGGAVGFHKEGVPAWKEEYAANHLVSGSYFSVDGKEISSVKNEAGIRSLFENGVLSCQQEIQEGFPQGKVTLFEEDGTVDSEYFIKDGKKDGKEIRFFHGKEKRPRLQIEWKEGEINGTVKTWYKNGTIESQKEMRGNTRHGPCMAWYPDGSVMLVEEYENDLLKKGSYHKRRESTPLSQVTNGEGVVTLFDDSGSVTERVPYHEGKPQVLHSDTASFSGGS